jgi:type IV secretion system protein VirB10
MNETFPDPNLAAKEEEDSRRLTVRGSPDPVVRFRRGVIVALAGGAALILVVLSWLALQPPTLRQAASAEDSGEPAREVAPEALADAPKGYGDVARLGPPLPGDLGRPILEHQRSVEAATAAPVGMVGRQEDSLAGMDQTASARVAARSAPLLVQTAERARPRDEDGISSPSTGETMPPIAGAATVPAGQQQKIEFARSLEGSRDPHVLTPPASRWMLAAGTIIPASLITGLNSDLPGMVVAQVTENVRDSATGSEILVPQGARLLGRYDSVIAYGQERALVVWNRILFPDGSSIELDNTPATDVSGYSGVSDRVDAHTWRLIKGVVLSTLLGVGTQLSLGNSEGDLLRAIRESAQQNAAHAGDQITSRNLEVQPTITVRPGWPVRAVLSKDLILAPWRA